MSFSSLILALSLAGPAAAAEIKTATLAPEGSTWMNVMKEFDKELREKTAGRVGFKIYPGGVSGDEKDVVRKIRFGQLHAAGFTGVGLGEILPDVRLLDLPFLFKDLKEVEAVRGALTERYREAFRAKGFELLAWADVGFVHVFSRKPIREPGDLKAMKVWVWQGDPVASGYMDELGVSAIPLSLPDVLSSLQTGMVDVVYASPLAAVALQWFTKVGYVADAPMTYSNGALLIARKEFEKLGPEDQEQLRRLAEKHMGRMNELTRKDNDKSMKAMAKRGVELMKVPQDSVQLFREAGDRLQARLEGKLLSSELLKEARDSLKALREPAKAPKGKGDGKAGE